MLPVPETSRPDGGHGHSHAHGRWRDWQRTRTLRVVLVVVLLAAAATTAGMVALWPSGAGQTSAISNARELGLSAERLSAEVQRVVDAACSYATETDPQDCRTVTARLNEGVNAGNAVTLPEFNLTYDRSTPDLDVGDNIVVGYEASNDFYSYADRDRRSVLLWFALGFIAIVIGFGRVRGLLALIAMGISLAVLIGFVGPSVLDGNDPILVSIVAAAAIAFVSLYLTHGITPTTTVAIAGTLSALGLTFACSQLFFAFANFTGLASEDALLLPFIADNLDLSGLLLGGAILGALGALDDVTVTQVATVEEIRRHDPALGTRALIASGIRVGRQHIASTVNTLLLAYAGSAMPLLLLFAVSNQSLGMIANSELIAVEIMRTLCGSIGLIAAVPITTALAAAVLPPLTSDAVSSS